MKAKIKTVLYPTIFAILMAVLSLGVPTPGGISGTPWLTAIHQQTMPDGQVADVDNIAYFLWGHQYTVAGPKAVQSQFVAYNWEDFPFYSMITVIVAIIIGALSLTPGRGTNIVIRGREIKLKVSTNPLTLLAISASLISIAAIYLYSSANVAVLPVLAEYNYNIVEYGYGIKFMVVSVVGFLISIVMTHLDYKKQIKEEMTEVVDSIKESTV
jgi:preprotein translocase subunit Sss1